MMFPVSALLDKIMGIAALPDEEIDVGSQAFWKGSLMRACLVWISAIIVIAVPDFAAIMGLIGSTCCMLLALILPGFVPHHAPPHHLHFLAPSRRARHIHTHTHVHTYTRTHHHHRHYHHHHRHH
jgi:hypothetical protein